jgi:hypothetical protein
MRAGLGAVAVLVSASLTAASLPPPELAAAGTPARLLVSADEYRLTLSRQRLIAGPAIIQLLNRGEDDHDLRLRRIVRAGRSPRKVVQLDVAAPGKLVERVVSLRPARYRLWCSLPGHRKLGMRALLRVSSAR